MSPSNVYQHSLLRPLLMAGWLLLFNAALCVFSSDPAERIFGAALMAAALLVAAFSRRRRHELRIEQDALSLDGLRAAWAEVDLSEVRERGARRTLAFTVMIKDPQSETGRRTLEVEQPSWPRFDELYDALRSAAPRRK